MSIVVLQLADVKRKTETRPKKCRYCRGETIQRKGKVKKPVRVLGIDGLYPLAQGKRQAVLLAVDLGNGQPVAIGQVDESNPWAVRRWLELVRTNGTELIEPVMVDTDYLLRLPLMIR